MGRSESRYRQRQEPISNKHKWGKWSFLLLAGGSSVFAVACSQTRTVAKPATTPAAVIRKPTSPSPMITLLVEQNPCVTEAGLTEAIERRSARITTAQAAINSAVVQVLPSAGSSPTRTGRLELQLDEYSSPIERQLSAETCEDLTNALAFVIALTLDPPSLPTETPAPPPKTPVKTDGEGAPTADAVAQQDKRYLRLGLQPDSSDSSPPPPQRRDSLRWGLGLGAVYESGPAPGGLLGGYVEAELALGGRFSDHLASPSFVARASLTRSTTQRFQGGAARFTHAQAILLACPIRLAWTAFESTLCARIAGGQLESRGQATLAATTVTRPWWEVGANLGARVFLSRAWSIEALGGVSTPLVRDRYQFEPVVFYQTPSITSALTLGIAHRW